MVALILVLLLSIENFAAVVGDNDGAAFITKAEFDSLKNNFQAQIDQYNTSIDSKIDGAIASYLAGISVAKVTLLKNLITNYNDIKWLNRWKWYGRWRTFSDYDSYTESSSDVWYIPTLNDQRIGFRSHYTVDPDAQLFKLYSNVWYEGYYVAGYAIKLTGFANGAYLGNRNNDTYMADWGNIAPGVNYILLEQEDDGLYYEPTATPYRYAWRQDDVTAAFPHKRSSSTWSDDYLIREFPLWLDQDQTDKVIFAAPEPGKVFKATLRLRNNYTTDGTKFSIVDQPDFKDLEFPVLGTQWVGTTNVRDALTHMQYAQMNSWAEGITTNYYQNGVHYNDMQNSSCVTQRDTFLQAMWGVDENATANIGYKKKNSNYAAYDFSVATASCLVTGELKYTNVAQPLYRANDTSTGTTNQYWESTTTIPITLAFPLWPQLKLSEINSRYYKYNGQPLKKGQGIPLVLNNLKAGIVHITANYSTNRIVSTYANTGIEVDIANKPFTDDGRKFIEGWEGPPEPMKDTSLIKDFAIDNTDKKIEISIPVKAEEDIWIRLKPTNDEGGYYAQLSNLNVTLVDNS